MHTALTVLKFALGFFGVVVLYLTLAAITVVSQIRPDVATGRAVLINQLYATALNPVFLMLAVGIVIFAALAR